MQDRQAQIAGVVEQGRIKREELERARARRDARAPFAGMKEEAGVLRQGIQGLIQ
jgi:hypothetical protein